MHDNFFKTFCHVMVDRPIAFLMGDAGWLCPLLIHIITFIAATPALDTSDPSHQHIPDKNYEKTGWNHFKNIYNAPTINQIANVFHYILKIWYTCISYQSSCNLCIN